MSEKALYPTPTIDPAAPGADGPLRLLVERKLAMERAEKSEAMLRSVLETAADCILTMDRSERIVFINRTLPHHTVEQVIGTNAFDYIPLEFRGPARAACAHVFQTGEKTEYETLGPVKPDGTRGWYLTRLGPLLHGQEVVAVTMCATDITERKRTEEQLRQSQKMEAIGQLASGVAHDFNNLLTIISGYSEFLLARMPAADPLRAAVSAIRESGEQAAAVTRQLLAFSRKAPTEPRVLDLNVVVGATERLLHRLIGEEIQLTAVLDPKAKPVRVDAGQMSQVLLNLAINARDAMPEGGKLTIATREVIRDASTMVNHQKAGPAEYVLLEVSDTGEGMTPEVQARIFEPFFTTKVAGKGTGLGLAVVYSIVKANGGDIEVFSTSGVGTTFRIFLPMVEETCDAQADLVPEASPHGSETILLAEDEADVRAFALGVLQARGYEVLAAGDGQEALRLAADYLGPINLLLTDVVLPLLDGPDLAEALQPRSPRMKVLYVSGNPVDGTVRRGSTPDEVSYLQKPYASGALARKVRELLDRP